MLSDLVMILICLVGAGFYAGIETGVISLHRMRLRHLVEQGDRSARILETFLKHPDRLLGTTLLGTNLCMVIASVLGTSVGDALMGTLGATLFGAGMTVVVLVFSEYLPKAWFQSHPIKRCLLFAPVLRYSAIVLRPLVDLVNWITQYFLPASVSHQAKRPLFSTKDELDLLAKESEEHGMLSPKQRIMIRRVFELSGRTAKDIMVPIKAVTVAKSDISAGVFLDLVSQSGHTRIPLYDESRRVFSGIVNFFDVVSDAIDSRDRPVTAYQRAPLFVPDSTPLTEIFTRLRLSRQAVCLVTNAESEVTGFITTQTVLEEIVGKL